MNKNIKIIITVVAIALIGGGIYFSSLSKNDEKLVNSTDVAGWRTYTDTRFGYEIKYPVHWKIDQNNGGLDTSVFINGSDEKISIEVSPVAFDQCVEKEWEQFVNYSVRMTKCFKGIQNVIKVEADTGLPESKEVVEDVIATFKFPDNDPATSKCLAGQMGYGSECKQSLVVTAPKEGQIISKSQPFEVKWEASPELGDAIINVLTEAEIGACKIGSGSGFKGVAEVKIQDKPGCFIPLGQHRIILEARNRTTDELIDSNSTGYRFTIIN